MSDKTEKVVAQPQPHDLNFVLRAARELFSRQSEIDRPGNGGRYPSRPIHSARIGRD